MKFDETQSDFVSVRQSDAELDGGDTSSDDYNISKPFDVTKIRIDQKPTQMDALIKRLRNDEIDMAPDFQRAAGIWTKTAQSRLIESLILRIPVPAFYFDASDDCKWIVVDGLQRLTTIKNFVVDETLELQGLQFLDSAYAGLKYSQLPRRLQRNIEEADVTMYHIQSGTPQNVKFAVFQRINTGGLPLNSQEIRHALNQGQSTRFLARLAKKDVFRIATDGGVTSKRMDDRECALRFIAFMIFSVDEYEEEFDVFLNKVMDVLNHMDSAHLKALEKDFERAMKRSFDIFGNDAFRKRYAENAPRLPVNKALFEAWSVNLAKLSVSEADLLVERRDMLRREFVAKSNRWEFHQSISQGTGSKAKVVRRFKDVRKMIRKVLDAE